MGGAPSLREGRRYSHLDDVLGDAFLERSGLLGEFRKALVGVGPVDVAERHQVLAGHVGEDRLASPADADGSDAEAIAGRLETAPEHVPWHDGESGRRQSDGGGTGDGRR